MREGIVLRELRVINHGAWRSLVRDECLNEHWFTGLLHARTVIETWRREYNEERPKKALGRLTPNATPSNWQPSPLR